MVPCEFVDPEIPKSHFGKFNIQFSPYSKLKYTELEFQAAYAALKI